MARGINKFIGVGVLGQDPITKYTPAGAAVTNISIAVSESWKDKNTGQQQERTEWINIVFFNRLAEIAGEYLKKGSKIYVEGQLRTQSWDDKETGKKMYKTEIVASIMQMLDSKGDSQQGGQQNQQQAQPQQQNQQPQRQANQSNSQGFKSSGEQYGNQQPQAQNFDPGLDDQSIPF